MQPSFLAKDNYQSSKMLVMLKSNPSYIPFPYSVKHSQGSLAFSIRVSIGGTKSYNFVSILVDHIVFAAFLLEHLKSQVINFMCMPHAILPTPFEAVIKQKLNI